MEDVMRNAWLVNCLQSYPRPEGVEAWVHVESNPVSSQVPDDYRQAVHDLLVGLGVIDHERRVYTSPGAYYFARSLARILEEKAFGPAQWQGRFEEAASGTGARLLRALELHRAEATPAPAALRAVRVVMAIIKGRRGDTDVYLMQYDHGARHYQPIGGKIEDDDPSNDAALARELSEELELPPLRVGIDYAARPLVERVGDQAVSASLHILTRYEHSFYHLTNIRFPLHTDSETVWLTRDELLHGQAGDGRRISMLVIEHLRDMLDDLELSTGERIAG